MDGSHDIDTLRAEFVEKIGLVAQGEGMARIAGRIFGLLIWEGEAVAFGELAETLQVSRGSVSTSARLLEERGLIKRVAKPGERQDYFQLASNPYAALLEIEAQRSARHRAEIDDTIAALPPGAGAAALRERLGAYAGFYATLHGRLVEAARDLSSKPGPAAPAEEAS